MNTPPFPSLETYRLRLRELLAQDLEALFRNYADPVMTQYFMEKPLERPEQAAEILENFRQSYYTGKGPVWALALKDSPPPGELIGTCGYEKIMASDRRGEIGYDIAQAYWGRGLMKEALRAVIDHSFTFLGLHRIEAYVLAENERSLGMLRSLGFQVEGILRHYEFFQDQYRDNVLMALLADEWRGRENPPML